MSPIKWLNHFLYLENLLGIHRNYCNQRKKRKYLIKFQIFVQTMLHTTLITFEVYMLLGRNNYSFMRLILGFFGSLACLNCVSSSLTGIFYSGAFMSYYTSITRVYELFKNDKTFINSMKKVYCVSIVFNVMFYCFTSYKTSLGFVVFLHSDSGFIVALFIVSQAIVRLTIVFQHLMLHVVVMFVVHLFKCMTSLVSAVEKSVKSSGSDERCDVTREQIQGWFEMYRDLVNCCEKLSLCYGHQYFFSMVLSIFQYIFLTYQMVYKRITNVAYVYDGTGIGIIVFSCISVLMMPLFAGQMTTNQGVKFHRVLARLYNKIIAGSGEAEAKMIKDFIRLIKNNPLEIKLLSKISVGLYILPFVLTLTVNYLIIMLQFNHII